MTAAAEVLTDAQLEELTDGTGFQTPRITRRRGPSRPGWEPGGVFASKSGKRWRLTEHVGDHWTLVTPVEGVVGRTMHRTPEELADTSKWVYLGLPGLTVKPMRRRPPSKRQPNAGMVEAIDAKAKGLLDVFDAAKHPTRLRILLYGSLTDRPDFSPVEVATDLQESLGTVAYHFRTLHNKKMVKRVRETRVRGAVEHHYALTALGEKVVKLVEAIGG